MKYILILLCLCTSLTAGSPSNFKQRKEAISAPIADSLSQRYSGRAMDPSRSVTKAQIRSLIEAARWAPSCYNDQPWSYIFCDRTTDPVGYNKALQGLVEFNQNWAKNAPLLIIAIAGSQFHKSEQPNRWAQYDTGAASMSISVQAASMGLMAHSMGGFDDQKLIKELQIPTGYTPMAVIAVGYEDKNDASVASERLPIQQNFFKGKWGNAFD